MSPQCISFLNLLEIMGIAFSRKVSDAGVLFLKSSVKGYLTNFKTTYNVNIIPKQHCLVHLPSQILVKVKNLIPQMRWPTVDRLSANLLITL